MNTWKIEPDENRPITDEDQGEFEARKASCPHCGKLTIQTDDYFCSYCGLGVKPTTCAHYKNGIPSLMTCVEPEVVWFDGNPDGVVVRCKCGKATSKHRVSYHAIDTWNRKINI